MLPVWAAGALGVLGATAVKMLMQLLTESFLRKAVVLGLERLANLTETDADNQLVLAAKEAWGMAEVSKEEGK